MQISTVQELLELSRGVCVPFFFSGTGFGAGCQVLLSCALHSTAPGRQFWSFPLSNKETGILHWKQVFYPKLIQISMFVSQTEWCLLLTCEELMRIIWKLPPSWKKIFQPILNYVRCRQRRSLTEENGTRWIFHYAVPPWTGRDFCRNLRFSQNNIEGQFLSDFWIASVSPFVCLVPNLLLWLKLI